jgi:hypothetical protein
VVCEICLVVDVPLAAGESVVSLTIPERTVSRFILTDEVGGGYIQTRGGEADCAVFDAVFDAFFEDPG